MNERFCPALYDPVRLPEVQARICHEVYNSILFSRTVRIPNGVHKDALYVTADDSKD